MNEKAYPLELILRFNGTAELVDCRDNTLWASDADEDFLEEFNNEFLTEDDIDDVLGYLFDSEILSEDEASRFERGEFETIEESMAGEDDMNERNIGPGDDEDEDDDYDASSAA
jgi:hypothetical protein